MQLYDSFLSLVIMLHRWRAWFIFLSEVQYGFESTVSIEATAQVEFDEFHMSRDLEFVILLVIVFLISLL